MVFESVYKITVYINNWNETYTEKGRLQNRIITTRYTWYNFVPVVLFEQFQKISNFYFLISLIINALIDSPVPFGLNVIPLIIVIVFSMIMRAFEDIKRHYADNEINEQRGLVLRNDKFIWCSFESLKVGDVIRCENNSPFPADVLLLFSSRESNDCSVTTVNLDGESNLKTFVGAMGALNTDEIGTSLANDRLEVHCIEPCEDLHRFHGLLIDSTESSSDGHILTEKNLLLRGSCLKNTEFIVGCVLYAGADTKLSLNSQLKTLKISIVDRRLTQFIMFYLILQVLFSIICGLVWNVAFFTDEFNSQHWYLPLIKIAPWKRVEGFLAFFTLFNRLIPISIIFAVYFLKAFAAFFFNVDLEIYDPETDQRARVNTIELIEELGQIEYLFCDKTGTLTENKMTFQRCAFDTTEFLDINDELCYVEDCEITKIQKPYDAELLDLFLSLCICHTVKVSAEDGSPNINFTSGIDVSMLSYQASSPDELAFLNAMRNYGIAYLGSKKANHYISVYSEIQVYVLRELLEFDSNRKCMSVLVDCPDGSTQLICKGAECSLFEMAENTVKINTLMKHLAQFSEDGLRVLVVGKKKITSEEAEDFIRQLRYYRTSPTLMDRESEVYSAIENRLTLVGVTGVEDKLQYGVPQTIQDLRDAGIKIWIITGDKEETAINISMSAGHISQEMHIHHLTGIASVESGLEKLTSLMSLINLSPNPDQKYALIVDGKSFPYLIQPELIAKFTDLCHIVHATLCCRMNPLQKAQTVKMIKENVTPTPITAAIGDGGNDVSMILEAHVGIGIFGKEGRQAARVADYAIGKFHFLRRIILIHGQNLYINVARLIDYYFYKSMLYVFPLFMFTVFSAFSMLNLYDSMSVALYNVTYSTMVPIAFAMFDKVLPDKERLKKPYLYREIQRNRHMTYSGMIKSCLLALVQAAIIFWFVYLIFSLNYGLVTQQGDGQSYLYFGEVIIYTVWTVTMVKLVLITNSIILWNILFFIANVVLCFIIQFIYQAFNNSLEYSLSLDTLGQPLYWLLMVVSVLVCSTVDAIIRLMDNSKKSFSFDHRRPSFKYTRTN